jgi:glycosyltransferase involved in cell wall biosynthesis
LPREYQIPKVEKSKAQFSLRTTVSSITVIVPCRNEEKFIRQCLDSIIANDYESGRLEILVVDGMSEDDTWDIACEYESKYPFLRAIRNPQKITPVALNIGLRNATGEIILRVDAHAKLGQDYLRRCVEVLLASGADNVGGSMETLATGRGRIPAAIATAMSHRFGAGNSHFRTRTNGPTYTDTVFGGCYRRDVFDRIGNFNERLPRGQDLDFNKRLRAAGGKILLDPNIRSYYYSSPDLRTFWRHNFNDGVWAILPFAYAKGMPVCWRHLVPLGFLALILSFSILSIWFFAIRVAWITMLATYCAASFACSAEAAYRRRKFSLLFLMPVVFGIRHFAYGMGSAWGIIKLIRGGSLTRILFSRANSFLREIVH